MKSSAYPTCSTYIQYHYLNPDNPTIYDEEGYPVDNWTPARCTIEQACDWLDYSIIYDENIIEPGYHLTAFLRSGDSAQEWFDTTCTRLFRDMTDPYMLTLALDTGSEQPRSYQSQLDPLPF